ncbi:zinc finger protein [Peziza echinospora]|nr:zinc finger protein [Peziza echinospora]
MTSVLSPSAAAQAQAPPATAQLSTHPFTCNTCQVAFRSSEQQRNHMHTDWHRYNLKRRITSLPPLTSELFAEKVLHIQATSRLQKEKASFEKTCTPCGKTYFSENAYANHLTSSKHKQIVEKSGATKRRDEKDETGSVTSAAFSFGTGVPDEDAEAKTRNIISEIPEEGRQERLVADKEFAEVIAGLSIAPKETDTGMPAAPATEEEKEQLEEEGEGELESLSLETCLFCTYVSPTLQLNVSHMSKAHGLFIPEQKYLVDLAGLIRYLGEKVSILNECLFCQKQKGGLEGVRTHMRDVGHCKIAYETEEDQVDIGEFYDFRSTYEGVPESDDEEDVAPKPKKGIRPTKSKKVEGDENFKTEDGGEGAEDAGWETDSSASSLDSTELCAVPIDHHHGTSSQEGGTSRVGSHHKEDGWHSRAHSHHHTTAVYHTEYELHLPSGRTAGHRSLNRYYRQNLSHPLSERASRKEEALRLALHAGTESDAEEVEEFDADAEDDAQDAGSPSAARGDIGRELTRREKRDLFFGRMTEEEKEAVVGPPRGTERGISSRQVGLTGLSTQKMQEVRTAEKRGRMLEERATRRMQWHIDQKGNSQKHYRDPLLQ